MCNKYEGPTKAALKQPFADASNPVRELLANGPLDKLNDAAFADAEQHLAAEGIVLMTPDQLAKHPDRVGIGISITGLAEAFDHFVHHDRIMAAYTTLTDAGVTMAVVKKPTPARLTVLQTVKPTDIKPAGALPWTAQPLATAALTA